MAGFRTHYEKEKDFLFIIKYKRLTSNKEFIQIFYETVNMVFLNICYLIFMGIFCFVVHNLYRICIFMESRNLNVIKDRGGQLARKSILNFVQLIIYQFQNVFFESVLFESALLVNILQMITFIDIVSIRQYTLMYSGASWDNVD